MTAYDVIGAVLAAALLWQASGLWVESLKILARWFDDRRNG